MTDNIYLMKNLFTSIFISFSTSAASLLLLDKIIDFCVATLSAIVSLILFFYLKKLFPKIFGTSIKTATGNRGNRYHSFKP